MLPEQALYTDFNKTSHLRKGAHERDPETIRKVAKQFESLFIQMMLKSMRDTVPESELFGSHSEKLYRDMYDKQLSLNISTGRGIGLAAAIERQLGGVPVSGQQEPGQRKNTIDAYLRRTFQQSVEEGGVVLSSIRPTRFDAAPLSMQPEHKPGPWQSPEAFIEDVWPYALRASDKLGVDPDVLVAQSALETGWGKHLPLKADGSNSFNLFGIKADHRWDGDSVAINTREYRHGVMQKEQARFRVYDSVSQAFEDYVNFIKSSPRYQKALEHGYDPEAYVRELQKAGYATDPNYARKINRVRGNEQLQNHSAELKNINPVPLT